MVEQGELNTNWTLVTTQDQLARASDSLAEGSGPAGVDAERASGFTYGSEAYLVQVHRKGSGTYLFDPTTLDDFTPLYDALRDEQWVLHAASQDLACLREIGLDPLNIFDTELAARLLGFERVGLGSLVEELLGIRLTKAHSAANWSTRPLPADWLEYAALDVVLLPDLRDMVEQQLIEQNKLDIAYQEFNAVLEREPKIPPAEPWRKLAGGNRLRSPRQLALARELWIARDTLARERDVAPGRLLPDSSLIVAAAMNPRSARELASNKEFRGRASRSELDRWWKAILRGKTAETPKPLARDPHAIPHHRSWPQKFPDAAARLQAAREALSAEAERQHMPVENLLSPEILRRIAWDPPSTADPQVYTERMRALGARPWQTVATAPILASLFVENQ